MIVDLKKSDIQLIRIAIVDRIFTLQNSQSSLQEQETLDEMMELIELQERLTNRLRGE